MCVCVTTAVSTRVQVGIPVRLLAHDKHATWHLEPSRKRMQLQFTNLPEFYIFVELQCWDRGQGFDLASQITDYSCQVGAAHCKATDDNNS